MYVHVIYIYIYKYISIYYIYIYIYIECTHTHTWHPRSLILSIPRILLNHIIRWFTQFLAFWHLSAVFSLSAKTFTGPSAKQGSIFIVFLEPDRLGLAQDVALYSTKTSKRWWGSLRASKHLSQNGYVALYYVILWRLE